MNLLSKFSVIYFLYASSSFKDILYNALYFSSKVFFFSLILWFTPGRIGGRSSEAALLKTSRY